MKFAAAAASATTTTLFWIHIISIISFCRRAIADDSGTSLLRGSTTTNRRLRVQQPCTLVTIETHYESEISHNSNKDKSTTRLQQRYDNTNKYNNDNEDDDYKCELQEEDRKKVGKYFVSINGIESDQLRNIKSGETTIMADGATIMDGQLYIPAGAAVEFGSSDNNNNNNNNETIPAANTGGNNNNNDRTLQQHTSSNTMGTKKVLVVRANGRGGSTTASNEVLSNRIFGTNDDNTTLRSQYLACSHGKLDFQPFQGETLGGTVVVNGVLDVNITTYIPGASRYTVEDALEEAADALVGDFRQQFDHVMLCLPPGTFAGDNDKWVAYGYVNSWLSVYNDEWCQKLSTQVHEMGHNLGLAHSSKDGISYGDKTGTMGYSYDQDDGPLQCFNPAKNYVLGWYEDRVIEIDPFEGTWKGSIVGVTDYGDNSTENSYVIVKIMTGGEKDLYVGYNRKKGMNSGVGFGGDNIIIVDQAPGYSKSDFKAALSSDDPVITFHNLGGFNENLVIEFLHDESSIDEAVVAIYFDSCVYPLCCEGSMCESFPTVAANAQIFNLLTNDTAAIQPSDPQNSTSLTSYPFDPQNIYSPTSQPSILRPSPFPTPQLSNSRPTPSPTRKRLHSVNNEYKSNSRPEQLLQENFRMGLGVFNSGGTRVKRTEFENILTAQFEMSKLDNLPFISTELDLKGNSFVKVYFWFNAEMMQSNEGFALQYSSSDDYAWSDVGKWRYKEDFDQLNKWNRIEAAAFSVSEGTTSVRIRFQANTTEANDSVFYIAGVNIYGTSY